MRFNIVTVFYASCIAEFISSGVSFHVFNDVIIRILIKFSTILANIINVR